MLLSSSCTLSFPVMFAHISSKRLILAFGIGKPLSRRDIAKEHANFVRFYKAKD